MYQLRYACPKDGQIPNHPLTCSLCNTNGDLIYYKPDSLVDGGGLQTFLCDPMHTLRSSGYTLSGIYIDDLSWSPRMKFQLGDQFISLIYTIPHTNS